MSVAPSIDLAALERSRKRALDLTGLLDSAPEKLFDLITALAAKAVNVPVVLISLVATDRQFFKSQHGLPPALAEKRETPLTHSFCQYVSALGEPLVVEDAREHPLVRENLAIPDFGVIAYAGMPLTTSEGFTLGSLCAIDFKPRRWTPDELEILRGFADQVMAEVEVRARVFQLDEKLLALRATAASRSEHARQIVHDLRTPLNALILGLEGLSSTVRLEGEQQECFDLAKRNADVLLALVQSVIDHSVGDTAANASVSCLPAEIFERALDQVEALAHKAGVALDRSGVRPMPAVRARVEELTRVLVNLVANGVKFTPRGGTITVSLAEEQQPGGSHVRFTVRDDGIGIASDDQVRVFYDGVRLDPNVSKTVSTGIGLSFCKRVIEEHGGHLHLESVAGEGSVFTFTLAPAGSVGSTSLGESED